MVKLQRQHIISTLIAKHKISSQEELLKKLSDKGIALTQATLSRDLKELRAGRSHDPEYGMVYTLPYAVNDAPKNETTQDITAIGFSNNLCVVKTRAGYASAVALQIDKLNSPAILGTIAGDDTILIIPQPGIKTTTIKQIVLSVEK